jgi:hypothetical protein
MARKRAARGRRARQWPVKTPLLQDATAGFGVRGTRLGHGATCRARASAGSGGGRWVARATEGGEEAGDRGSVCDDRADGHATSTPGASFHVHVEGAAEQGRPIQPESGA